MNGNKTQDFMKSKPLRFRVRGTDSNTFEGKDCLRKGCEARNHRGVRSLSQARSLNSLLYLAPNLNLERGEQMNRLISIASLITLVLAITATVNAQTSTKATDDSRRATRVLVSGDSIVQAQPDTAVITIAVVTQAKQAIDAQQQNATKSDAVMRALKSAAGTGAEVKTSGYNLQPQRIYKEGQPPTITGYEARNSVTVTVADLTKIGAVIDAAGQAGANDVGGISFTLRNDRPVRIGP